MDSSTQVDILAEGLLFPEAPVALPDGSVLLAEVRSGHIRHIDPAGRNSLYADCGGGPCGLAFGPDGALYVCNNGGNVYRPDHFLGMGPAADYQGGSIQRVDPVTRAVTTLVTHCDGHRLSAPNDIVFDAHGSFYFTDMGKKFARHRDHGGLYHARCDGTDVREVAYQVAAANGVGLSPDGRAVYAAETETSRLWAFDLVEPGRIARQPFPSPHGGRLVCGLPGFQRFDSLAVEAGGNICVATLMTGHVSVIAPDGRLLRQLALPDRYVTNICFGGPDMRTAFITLAETGRLAAVRWPEPGLPLHFAPRDAGAPA